MCADKLFRISHFICHFTNITILKCTSAYSAKLEDMNLNTIKDMYEKFAPQGVKIWTFGSFNEYNSTYYCSCNGGKSY